MTKTIGRPEVTFEHRPCGFCYGEGFHRGYLKTDYPGCFPGVVKCVESRTACSACHGRGTIPYVRDKWGQLRKVRVRPRVGPGSEIRPV